MKEKNIEGFTFTELLVVVAIISFLLVIAIPISQTAMMKAKVRMATADIAKLDNAVQLYKDDYGFFPTTLRVLVLDPNNNTYAKFTDKQLLGANITDPWGTDYLYDSDPSASVNGNNKGFVDIASAGPDKTSGTWQKDRNIHNIGDDATLNSDGFPAVLDNINNWSTKQ